MKIIIIGAGRVGTGVAEYLVNENNDVTVIDTDNTRLMSIQNRFDLKVVIGYGSYPATLREANAANADLLVAVTDSDETNMLACQLGSCLFHIPQKIARIQNHEYLAEKNLIFGNHAIAVDNIIAPEQLVTMQIANLIEYPGTIQITEFAGKKIALVGIRVYYGGILVGQPISRLHENLDNTISAKIIAIYRQGRAIATGNSTVIEAGDEVFFISAKGYIRTVMAQFQKLEAPFRRIMIIGGGDIGCRLAHELSQHYSVKLVEINPEHTESISQEFDNTNVEVFCCDPSSQEFLTEEHVNKMDLVVSVTGSDENNIMAAMLAKRLGARRSIVLISKMAYISLIQDSSLDIIISPQETTISALLTNIRHNGVETVYTLRRGEAESMSIKLTGDVHHSDVIGRPIREIPFPSGVIVCAAIRGDEIFMASGDFILEAGDEVVFYVLDKRSVSPLIKLTTPKVSFFTKLHHTDD